MTAAIEQICDPGGYSLDDAIERAKAAANESPGFEFDVSRFLQSHSASNHLNLQTIFRGLEVLGGMVDESRLFTLLRPFLRSSDAQIASKCVLVLGRRSQGLTWLRSVRSESDDRMRANLIESLWRRQEPDVKRVLKSALKDRHPRVAANAVYGLYLLGSSAFMKGLDQMLGNDDPAFRRSAIWVIKSCADAKTTALLKPLIRDPDPVVKHAAFAALISLRENAAKKTNEAPAPAVEVVVGVEVAAAVEIAEVPEVVADA